jgi:two-component system, NarL family, response regulator DevR
VKIRLLIVDDHQLVRVGLRTTLDRYPQLEVVGEAGTVHDAVQAVKKLQPDVVLLDMRLGEESGLDVCKRLQALEQTVAILVLTSYGEDQLVFDAIANGADGYLLKEVGSDVLVRSIEQVASGRSVLDPAVTRAVFSLVKQGGSPSGDDKLQILSEQERKVLALVADGKTNKEIASAMGLSDKTVKNYFSNTLKKLGFSRRSQAAAFFVQQGQSYFKRGGASVEELRN